MKLQWTTRTTEQKGIELPWKRMVFRSGRNRLADTGTVFIPQQTLEAVAERTEDDYLYGLPLFDLDDTELLALKQHQLAVVQPHRGYYGTDRLRRFLKEPGGAH